MDTTRLHRCLWTAALALPIAAHAVPAFFGGNAYEPFQAPGIDWDAANAIARDTVFEGARGHLATITSREEDEFLHELHQTVASGEFWVGGVRTPCEPEPFCGWSWVNDEGAFPGTNEGPGYALWFEGEPNGDGFHSTIGRFDPFMGWNDEGELSFIQGFVVEWELGNAVPVPGSLVLISLGMLTLCQRIRAAPTRFQRPRRRNLRLVRMATLFRGSGGTGFEGRFAARSRGGSKGDALRAIRARKRTVPQGSRRSARRCR